MSTGYRKVSSQCSFKVAEHPWHIEATPISGSVLSFSDRPKGTCVLNSNWHFWQKLLRCSKKENGLKVTEDFFGSLCQRVQACNLCKFRLKCSSTRSVRCLHHTHCLCGAFIRPPAPPLTGTSPRVTVCYNIDFWILDDAPNVSPKGTTLANFRRILWNASVRCSNLGSWKRKLVVLNTDWMEDVAPPRWQNVGQSSVREKVLPRE